MKNVSLDMAFPHSYEVRVLDELPASISSELRHIYFPSGSSVGGQDGIVVKVSPQGTPPWLGTFAFGYDSPKAVTGVFSCPARRELCIVSSGKGYLLDAANPDKFIQVESYPILDVRLIVESRLLIFVDFTSMSAYGQEGLTWTTQDISWDGLTITSVTADHIEALAWDAPLDGEIKVQVDLSSGLCKGGSSKSLRNRVKGSRTSQ